MSPRDRSSRLAAAAGAALAAGAVLFASAALALPPMELSGGLGDQIVPARSYDLVSTQDGQPQLCVTVALQPFARLPSLWIEVDYAYGATGSPLHQTATASLALD